MISTNLVIAAYWQPEIQDFTAGNGLGTCPEIHGQATSFFTGDVKAQNQFAFIPDDCRATYVIDVNKNTTTVLAAPSSKDKASEYTASSSALVCLDSNGSLTYLAFDANNIDISVPWTSIATLPIH